MQENSISMQRESFKTARDGIKQLISGLAGNNYEDTQREMDQAKH